MRFGNDESRDSEVAAFVFCIASKSYSERQLALVRARMPMKLGVKMVEANTRVINARYMWFSCGAATGIPGMRRSTTALCSCCTSVGAVLRS